MKIIRAVTVSQSLGFCRGIMIEMRRKGYEMVALSSPGKELDKLCHDDGFRTIAVPMKRRMAPLHDFMSLWNLIKVFNKEKPDMVHSMTPKAGLLCMMAAWITRIPKRVHTFTGLVWPTATGVSKYILMFTDWLTCACATHVIPEGKGVMNDLKQHITNKPMHVLGYGNVRGVHLKFWSRENVEARTFNEIKNETFTFLFVGRIVKDKGINELIEAFMQIRHKIRVRLLLVGKYEDDLDPISNKARRLIAECNDIVWVGEQHGKKLLAYYAASDCFVFPSYREGFPNTVLEAGAMNLPSIVTNINGSREIIENGANGLIIEPKNVEALAFAMTQMVEDSTMREHMADLAGTMIKTRFEQGFVRKCLIDFYKEII